MNPEEMKMVAEGIRKDKERIEKLEIELVEAKFKNARLRGALEKITCYSGDLAGLIMNEIAQEALSEAIGGESDASGRGAK